MPIRPRQTFLMKSGPSHDPERLHLHVVCLDVDDDGNTLIVPVSSYYSGCDSTCILKAGTHELINRESYILYRKAQIRNADELQASIVAGMLIPQKDMSQHFFLMIRNGVGRSIRTPRNIKKYFNFRKPNNG